MLNKLTGFRKCFADDDKYYDINPQFCLDNYMGRIIILTGNKETEKIIPTLKVNGRLNTRKMD